MALRSLSLRGFRNLKPLDIELSGGANYLFGPNGAGKTNLLEAIHYLAIGRSFRRCPDDELVGFGAAVLVASGRDGNGSSAEVRYDRREKRLTLNGAKRDKLSEYLGWLPVVALLLEDIELVRGGPANRRAFLDMTIAKVDRSYVGAMGEYRRALAQRNRLLERRPGGEPLARDADAAWEDQLVRAGVRVYDLRRTYIDRLLGGAAEHAARLAGVRVEFEYRPSILSGREEEYRRRLGETQARALLLGQTLVGPHRDDILIRNGERDLRRFGSVGEQRLAGVALRLAEAGLLGAHGAEPTFLLDEVASELDEERSRMVFEAVAGRGQMIYAAARRFVDGPAGPAKEFRIEKGEVHPVPAAR